MRSRVGAALIVVYAFASLFFQLKRIPPDGVDAHLQRFEAIKKELSPPLLLGYLPEPKASTLSIGRYYLAQYALAPVVLEMGTRPPLVLAVFAPGTACPATLKEEKLSFALDGGDGVCLYQAAP